MISYLKKIWVVAFNTFKEAVRSKILYSIVFFTVLILVLSTVMDIITIGQRAKIIKDMGLLSISVFGALIAIFVGIGLVYKEVDKRTIFTVISKPVSRTQFIIGKYCGLVLTIFVEVLAMSAIFFAIVMAEGSGIKPTLVWAVLFTFMELMVICAVAILFSSFSTPILSGMLTLALYLIGHLSGDLLDFSVRFKGTITEKYLISLYYIFPNLDNFNLRTAASHDFPITISDIIYPIAYGVVYITILLIAASYIFNRRDFK